MIRIGFSRWFIESGKIPMNHGQVKHYVTLRPQAQRFKIYASEWKGIHHSMVEKEVPAESVIIESVDDLYGMNPLKEMQLIRKLADEAASEAVYKCYSSGILAHKLPELDGININALGQVDEDSSRALLVYIVQQAIMRVVSSGISDEDETEEVADLVQHMKELFEQQQAERRARAAERAAAAAEMRAEQAYDRERYAAMREGAVKTSFDLLMGFLSTKEKAELDEKGYVTVVNTLGEFRVPVSKHGFVEQYVDGKHVQDHCIVFADFMIPPGDEALMKIALLKTDPKKFMKTSNKQPVGRW